ncbi:helix-turn-helix domain-containing protein [Polynucleobacter arcticus]|uniref:Helix-turn-helix domain-containing protein n=1 Tax=Polynucleobacter arcticus TaxID=1743165 RepID=A0A6M9PI22_9BURK|nr:helix-turn-helix domain-containing protein [Polynucleobacter arcticus]QKM60059.1 hypothetical protein DN92_02840 [Polynucleobacter arcticus]
MIDNNVVLIDTKQAAKILDVSPHTLDVWRATNRYPLPFIRIGRKIRYRMSDLCEFIDRNVCNAGGLNG